MSRFKTQRALRILSGNALSVPDFAGLYAPEQPQWLLPCRLFLGRIQKAGLIKKRNGKYELTEKGRIEIESELFDNKTIEMELFNDTDFGAEFSPCRKYRYALWRIWDRSKPFVMFVGLNPSTANETEPDNTIKSVSRISKSNGFGGFYMMNCFPFVSTNPDDLRDFGNTALNDSWLYKVAAICGEIVFAWGAFKVVRDLGRDVQMKGMFPNAKCLAILKDGSPKHPLYCRRDSKLIIFTHKF